MREISGKIRLSKIDLPVSLYMFPVSAGMTERKKREEAVIGGAD